MASLADIGQQYSGTIPVDIVKKWVIGKKSKHLQKSILSPFRKTGYLVSSDSAGLSKLSKEKGLVEMMKIVSFPKELIYAYGTAIGGRGVGIWAADNTQMFYDKNTTVEELIEQMAGVQHEIINLSSLQVGIGIQYAEYLEIGNGFFGHDADIIDEITENYSNGKDLLITEAVKEKLSKNFIRFITRILETEVEWPVYKFNYDGLGMAVKKTDNYDYPIPFTEKFYNYIRSREDFDDDDQKLKEYLFEKTVVLIKIYHSKTKFFLDQVVDWVVMNDVLMEIKSEYDVEVIKSNGDLGIFVSDDVDEAISFAEAVLNDLRESKDPVSIGVTAGDVLIFDLPMGGKDIAGDPVNIASKISEDIDEMDSLYIHDSVKSVKKNLRKYIPFNMVKSHVEIKGIKYNSLLD